MNNKTTAIESLLFDSSGLNRQIAPELIQNMKFILSSLNYDINPYEYEFSQTDPMGTIKWFNGNHLKPAYLTIINYGTSCTCHVMDSPTIRYKILEFELPILPYSLQLYFDMFINDSKSI